MRLIHIFALLVVSSGSVANPINVGGESIEIPTPTGFARVTPEMTEVNALQKHFIPPTNDQLAAFISQEDAPEALAGEIPDLRRRFTVQVAKNLAAHSLTPSEFAQLKAMFKADGEQKIEQMKGQLSGLLSDASKGVSSQLDTDLVIKVGGVVPLPSHFEDDRSFSSSMLMKNDYKSGASESFSEVISATMTLVYVKNRLIFVYSYGGKDDLDWTREKSKEWTEAIVSANSAVSSGSAAQRSPSTSASSLNWDKVIAKGIGGAFLALIVALISWAIGRRKES